MPKPPLPSELQEFLSQPNPSVIATLRADGSPHTAATWYLWEQERILVNMDASRVRLAHMRRDPRASITVLGAGDWYHHVTLSGRVAVLEQDPDCGVIDRISRHYTGEAYQQRDQKRWSAWIEIASWHSWAVAQPWS